MERFEWSTDFTLEIEINAVSFTFTTEVGVRAFVY